MMKKAEKLRNQICETGFTSVPEKEYGPLYKEHLLRQYDIYIKTLNHTSDVKQKVNSFFLTLHTLLITAMGISFTQENPFISNGGQFALPLVGIIICIIWWAIVYSYKQRSIVKTTVVQCVEDYLPLSLYQVEWKMLKSRHGGFRYHFFKISLLIPWVFIILYAFILIFSV